jgi:hypothetical protein
VALFSIDGNHVGYENQLDLPNRINFDGSFLKFGPFKVSLAPLDGALAAVINAVNKTIVPGIEFLQYRSYNAVTSRVLVRKAASDDGRSKHSRTAAFPQSYCKQHYYCGAMLDLMLLQW